MIDYTQEDFTGKGQTYDIIFDAVGKHSFRRCRSSLKRGGTYLATDNVQNLILTWWTSRIGERRVLLPSNFRRSRASTRYVETEQKTGNVVLAVSGDCRT